MSASDGDPNNVPPAGEVPLPPSPTPDQDQQQPGVILHPDLDADAIAANQRALELIFPPGDPLREFLQDMAEECNFIIELPDLNDPTYDEKSQHYYDQIRDMMATRRQALGNDSARLNDAPPPPPRNAVPSAAPTQPPQAGGGGASEQGGGGGSGDQGAGGNPAIDGVEWIGAGSLSTREAELLAHLRTQLDQGDDLDANERMVLGFLVARTAEGNAEKAAAEARKVEAQTSMKLREISDGQASLDEKLDSILNSISNVEANMKDMDLRVTYNRNRITTQGVNIQGMTGKMDRILEAVTANNSPSEQGSSDVVVDVEAAAKSAATKEQIRSDSLLAKELEKEERANVQGRQGQQGSLPTQYAQVRHQAEQNSQGAPPPPQSVAASTRVTFRDLEDGRNKMRNEVERLRAQTVNPNLTIGSTAPSMGSYAESAPRQDYTPKKSRLSSFLPTDPPPRRTTTSSSAVASESSASDESSSNSEEDVEGTGVGLFTIGYQDGLANMVPFPLRQYKAQVKRGTMKLETKMPKDVMTAIRYEKTAAAALNITKSNKVAVGQWLHGLLCTITNLAEQYKLAPNVIMDMLIGAIPATLGDIVEQIRTQRDVHGASPLLIWESVQRHYGVIMSQADALRAIQELTVNPAGYSVTALSHKLLPLFIASLNIKGKASRIETLRAQEACVNLFNQLLTCAVTDRDALADLQKVFMKAQEAIAKAHAQPKLKGAAGIYLKYVNALTTLPSMDGGSWTFGHREKTSGGKRMSALDNNQLCQAPPPIQQPPQKTSPRPPKAAGAEAGRGVAAPVQQQQSPRVEVVVVQPKQPQQPQISANHVPLRQQPQQSKQPPKRKPASPTSPNAPNNKEPRKKHPDEVEYDIPDGYTMIRIRGGDRHPPDIAGRCFNCYVDVKLGYADTEGHVARDCPFYDTTSNMRYNENRCQKCFGYHLSPLCRSPDQGFKYPTPILIKKDAGGGNAGANIAPR